MAKGNMLQGQATGKVGDLVFMVRNGQQVARVYTAAGGRSGAQASIAVRRQRVRFGAASNQYLLYRNIVRGMYRTGKSTKQSDYNFFVRENVDLLPYLTRDENAAGVKCVMPGTFSRGTLGNLQMSILCPEVESGPRLYEVHSYSVQSPATLTWDNPVSELKAALKSMFPNARKVTYSVSNIVKTELSLPSGSAWSHTLDRGDVVFDLFDEDANVPDTDTIAKYFQHYGPASMETTIFHETENEFMDGPSLFKVETGSYIQSTMLDLLYVQIFATNDQVGDCYTSTISSISVPDSDGGLSLYNDLRTDNHRQVAEDSYGYSTGVMRTNIQQA